LCFDVFQRYFDQRPRRDTCKGWRKFKQCQADSILPCRSGKKILQKLKLFIKEAIQIEKDGLQLVKAPPVIEIIPELRDAFKKNPSLKKSFDGLTPCRQRGDHIFSLRPNNLPPGLRELKNTLLPSLL